MKGSISRRQFLELTGAAGAFVGLAGSQTDAAESKGIAGPPTQVENVGGVPTFTVDGEPLLVSGFETYVPEARYFRQFADAGTRLFMFNTNAAACDYGHSDPTWKSPDEWDYSQFEQRAARILAARPDALLLPRVNLGTPRWWLEQHPETLEALPDGSAMPPGESPTLPQGRAFPSLASPVWRAAIGAALRRFLGYVQGSRFAPHIFGYQLSGGHTEEWYHWACGTSQPAGYSAPTVRAFRRWLRVKYRETSLLRDAWRRSDIDFATATVPGATERLGPHPALLRDPSREMQTIDFLLFWNELIPETIDYFAGITRSETLGQKVIGAFYGYLYEFAGDPEFGHNGVGRLLRSPNIDFMSVTASYGSRQAATGSDYQRSPAASLRLHGKLWYHGNDVVSYRAKERMRQLGFSDEESWTRNLSVQLKSLGYTDTPEKSRWMYRRGAGFAMANGMFQSWFDLHGGYFDAPELMEEVALLNRSAATMQPIDRSSIAEILVVADEASCAYVAPKNGVLRQALLEPQNQLTRVGAPCDHVLLEDLDRVDPRRYKFVIFLNCYHMSEPQRRVIVERFQHGGRHLLWFGAPALFQTHLRSLRAMEAVTGFRFREPDEPDGFPLIDDGTALQLADSHRADDLLAKSKEDWTSIYTRVPNLSAGAFRELAHRAGVHIFSHSDDVLYVNCSLLVIHSQDSGPRTLILPYVSDITDALTSDSLALGRRITLDLEMGETRWLRWRRAGLHESSF